MICPGLGSGTGLAGIAIALCGGAGVTGGAAAGGGTGGGSFGGGVVETGPASGGRMGIAGRGANRS